MTLKERSSPLPVPHVLALIPNTTVFASGAPTSSFQSSGLSADCGFHVPVNGSAPSSSGSWLDALSAQHASVKVAAVPPRRSKSVLVDVDAPNGLR